MHRSSIDFPGSGRPFRTMKMRNEEKGAEFSGAFLNFAVSENKATIDRFWWTRHRTRDSLSLTQGFKFGDRVWELGFVTSVRLTGAWFGQIAFADAQMGC